MDASFALYGLTTALQILLVDLLLGADNALMIGLASRGLPAEQRKRATVIGVAAAVVLRLLMSVVATSLLAWPFVKLVGAIVLVIIALNLAREDGSEPEASQGGVGDPTRMWAAAGVIVLADATMSLDNVVALAAIAHGSYLWLFLGVGLSLPMLGYGGMLVADWLHRAPGLVIFGAALLGWIAGGMATSDALWAAWIDQNAPGLGALAPALVAAFVFLFTWWVPAPAPAPKRARSIAPALRTPPPKPAPVRLPTPAPAPANSAPAPETTPASRGFQEKAVIFGMLLLALIAGGFLVLVTVYGGLE